ncbi:MAG TPA: GAF domain-containing protein [Sideroxyarcus sp.]|nr:GAF domain-containing protein [Sideroxyarcus sp.]
MNGDGIELSKLGNRIDFLLRFAGDIIFLMDEDGNLLEANDVAVSTYGWPLPELLKMNIRDLRDPETLGDVPRQLKLTAETGALFETRHKRRDGSVFPVEVSSRLFEYGGKKYRQSIVRDITERYKMQNKLERDARRFEGLLALNDMAFKLPEKDFMQFGLEWVERLTESKIAFIHFVNDDQESIELVAWSAATRDKYCTAAYDNHYPVAEAGIWADCLRQHKPVIFNDYQNYPDKHGLPEGHSALVRLISVPVIEGDKVRVILGVGNKDSAYDEEDVEVAQLFGNDMWRIIRRVRVEAELKANLEKQRALNKRLEEAQMHLLQSEKMASLGQLAAGVAHELNNPIGFVYSNMGTLENYLNDIFIINAAYEEAENSVGNNCPALEGVHKLKLAKDYDYIKQDIFQLMAQSRDGLARMRKIVQDLKDFSHVGEEGWKWVDLHKGIDSTLNIVWNELKYKCQVNKEYGTLPEVYCMASQINQVFLNMLVNAGQAIETKGVITIRTGVEGEEVWVEIADTGKGIPPEQIKLIFDPFFTTKPVGVGTGLGLSLSYGIMQKHHGRIEVSSEVGKGTTMRIWLPIKPAVVPA